MDSARELLTPEEFVRRAIVRLRDLSKSRGIHSVFSGFNAEFRGYFHEDPVKVTQDLARQGKIEMRICRGGAMLYLPGEAQQSKTHLDKLPRLSKRRHSQGVLQDLFAGLSPLQTRLIVRRRDFEELFDGFTRMRAISYVISPDLLLEFFDHRGYRELEVVVGDNLSEVYRKDLEQKSVEVTDRLAELVEKGALRIFVPSRTIHTKLYVLEREDVVRVIQTSANLTATAQEAKKQINYAWYLDIPRGHLLLDRLMQDYESHLHGCSLFMEDLQNLINERRDVDRKQLIEIWLKGGGVEEQQSEVQRVFQELSLSLAQVPNPQEEPVLTLTLPESRATRRIERLLEPLKPIRSLPNQLTINGSSFIRYVYENHRIPFLRLNGERRELLLGVSGTLKTLTEPPPTPTEVGQALAHIEDYIQTVDSAKSIDPLYAKTSMFEALLYVFFAPFAHEYMKAKRTRFKRADVRGPRFLYIYGPSQNGKSTFLRFVLRLLTGTEIEPLSRQDFTPTRIRNAASIGTAFPLVFDDVDPSRAPGLEDIFKSYWERLWQEQYVSPQLIITSNSPRLKDWAKSRVKRVDFDVLFAPTEQDKETLGRLLSVDNPVYRWFSYIYLQHLQAEELPSDDELQTARSVVKELYEYACRDLPAFFPREPIERIYDPGRKDWRDLLYILGKTDVRREGSRVLITFSKDMQPWEISHYEGYLPQQIKHGRRGNTLIIETPREFDSWLGQRPQARGLLSRFLRRS